MTATRLRRAPVLVVAGLVACTAHPSTTQRAEVTPSPSATASASPTSAVPSTAPTVTVTALAHPPVVGALVVSHASSTVVQPQPPAGTCHARGAGALALPDPGCTPGALNPAVTQATLGRTICVSGYTRTIRPAYSITAPEKRASMRAYGDPPTPGAYEYDHLVSLELGGAANDARNLWPEPGGSPNPKDSLENRLHSLVCSGALSLAAAQHAIATDWVSAYRRYVGTPAAPAATAAPATTPAAASGGACTATVSAAHPPRGGSETVTVRTAAGARVRTLAHYKTTTSEHDGVADARGVASISFSIGHPTAGWTVRVDVSTSSGQSCTTAFTPQ